MNLVEQSLPLLSALATGGLPLGTRLALEMLDRLEGGALAIELPGGIRLRAGSGAQVANLVVRDHGVFDEVIARGDIGFSECWMAGRWETDDLSGLLTLLARNRRVLAAGIYGRVLRLLGHRIRHLLRANTRRGARRNIEQHYDLGNDFYSLWLDPTMTYSAAVFAAPDEALEQAQLRKYRRILEQAGARPGQRILEIGSGWGGFAEVAATEFGCHVIGITLSPSQLAFARERALRQGFADRADFQLCDYRDIGGQYDHVVSIEMIEAVGERYWPAYFAQLAARLKPGGRAVVQAITIADRLFARYRRGTDFIQRHIFPGGMLLSPASVARQSHRAGLEVIADSAFGSDYARTLERWREAFEARLEAVRELGFDERFMRMWRFYLSYCEAGFTSGDVDLHQYVFAHRGESR